MGGELFPESKFSLVRFGQFMLRLRLKNLRRILEETEGPRERIKSHNHHIYLQNTGKGTRVAKMG